MPIASISTLDPAGGMHWRNLMAAVPSPVIVSDARGQILYVNDAVRGFFGYEPEQLIGQAVEMLVPQDRRGRHGAHRAEYYAEPSRRLMARGADLHAVRADGSEVVVAISLGFTRTDSNILVIAVIEDLSELRRRDQSIADLEKRDRELEDLNRELEAFSASVSHDLRAPLRAIDGFSQVLEEDYSQNWDDYGKSCLARVRIAAQHMGQVIDDLLKLSRITRSELNSQPLDLGRTAREIADRLSESAPERAVEFVVDAFLHGRGDAGLIRILLENLIGNAWKFSSGGSSARIEVGRCEVDEEVAFYVRDNGAGFDMQYAEKLFGAFQRLHSADEFPGTGIGLATVQRIAHKHGGRVWAEARPGKGATFYFTLAGTTDDA